MRWLRRFRSSGEPLNDEFDLDLDQLAVSGMTSPAAARDAVGVLETERKVLRRRLKVLSRQLKRMTSVRVRDVGRSGPVMGSVQMSHDMQAMQEAGLNGGLAMQEADTIARLDDVEKLIRKLKDHGRSG